MVYRARDRRYASEVALKLLSEPDADNLRLFKREFRAMAHLSHRNLVSLYELHQEDEQWFFTMELVHGIPLGEWLATRPGHWAELRSIFAQLATATDALHRAGLLHGDLKPSNALVTAEGLVRVGDFGMVRPAHSDGGAVPRSFGTVAYSAPELWTGEPVGPGADWYSLGAILFEALVDRPAFAGDDLTQLIAERTLRDGPRPSDYSVDADRDPTGDLSELCASLLKRNPAERPTGAEVLRAFDAEEPGGLRDAAAFVGRDAEMEALRASLAATRETGARVVLLQGPSGIGKSALAARFTRASRREGALVLEARCHPSDGLVGRALDELVDGLVDHLESLDRDSRAALLGEPSPALARMYPAFRAVLRPLDGLEAESVTAQRRAALRALARLFDRLAARGPLVLFVDDLQWADEGSGADLGAVLAEMRGRGALLLATLRSDHLDAPCPRALRRSQLDHARALELGPLGEHEVDELLRAELGEAASALRPAAISRAAGGNPYLVREIAELQRERPAAVDAPGEGPDDWTHGVVARREQALRSAGRRMLRAVALGYGPLGPRSLIEACELDEGEYLAELSVLRAERLATTRLSQSSESVEPYHSWVREAVTRATPPAEREATHRRLGRALLRTGEGSPEAVARHLFAGGARAEARGHAERAASEAAEALAFGRAADLWALALDCGVADPSERSTMERARADALANAGRGGEASSVLLSLARSEPEHALEHERRAAEQLLYGGRIDRGIALVRGVLARVGLRYPRFRLPAVAKVVWAQRFGPARDLDPSILHRLIRNPDRDARVDALHAATLGLSMTEPLASAALQVDHLKESIAGGDPHRLARALCIHAVQTAGGWYAPERTARIMAVIDALVAEHAEPRIAAEVALTRAGVAWMEGRLVDAVDWTERAGELLRTKACVGMPWHLDTNRIVAIDALESLGRWDDAEQLFAPAVTDARERGDGFLEASLLVRWGVTRELRADRPDEAHAALERAEVVWGRSEIDPITLQAAVQRARIARHRGDVEGAYRWMEATSRRMARSLLWRAAFYRDRFGAAHADTMVAWLRAGAGPAAERARVRAAVAAILERLEGTGAPVPMDEASRLRAILG